MTTLGAQVTPTGVIVPDYADILQQLKILYWQIYGSDADLDDDTMDGQWIGVLAQAIYDAGLVAQDVYNSFSPATAQGTGLSQVVKINGLARLVDSNSTADVTIVGVGGTIINNGVIGDNLGLGTQWTLPSTVTIDAISGTVDATVTCTTPGSVTAAAGSLTNILTPTRGWQTVTNAEAAAPGEPVETDAQLRARQSQSTALPALSVLDSIYASIAAIAGVIRLFPYENDSDITDGNGVPSHSISIVVQGGDANLIAQAIALKKTPGSGTYGSTSITVIDPKGVPNVISFYPLALTEMGFHVGIKALTGFVSTTTDVIVQALVDFVNALDIGEESYLARLYTAVNLGGVGLGATFVITSITQGPKAGPLVAADFPIAFNAAAFTATGDVTTTVT